MANLAGCETMDWLFSLRLLCPLGAKKLTCNPTCSETYLTHRQGCFSYVKMSVERSEGSRLFFGLVCAWLTALLK